MREKLKSRSVWLVLLMYAATVYLADHQEWEPFYVLIAWVILISGWFGGKAWGGLLEVVKAWLAK